ncbi:MAG: DUF4192 domain-containing protein [Micropruina sp.]|nr:DUF4192 domain-containing protein [Micropruina sp.]
MSEPTPPELHVRNLGDLAELVPYLVGFEPRDSLVALVIDRGHVAVTARFDLADAGQPGGIQNILGRLLARYPQTPGVYLMAYTDNAQTGWDLLQRGQQHLGSKWANSMLINGDTWYAPGGATGAVNRSGPLAAEATFHGLQRRDSRRAVEADLASPPDTPAMLAQLEAATDALADLPQTADIATLIDRSQALLNSHLSHPERLAIPDAIEMAILTLHNDVRDAALLSITSASAEQHSKLWTTVVQRTPAVTAEAPLFLAGMASWINGDGARAAVALQRLEAEPRPLLIGSQRRLAEIIDDVIPPQVWDIARHRGLLGAHPAARAAAIRTAGSWETVTPPQPTDRPDPRGPSQEPRRLGPSI